MPQSPSLILHSHCHCKDSLSRRFEVDLMNPEDFTQSDLDLMLCLS